MTDTNLSPPTAALALRSVGGSPTLTNAQLGSLGYLQAATYLIGSLASASGAAGSPQYWKGGEGTFGCVGAFGGGSVVLQCIGPDGVDWITVPNTSLSANGVANFDLPPCWIQASISGATAPLLTACAQVVPVIVGG